MSRFGSLLFAIALILVPVIDFAVTQSAPVVVVHNLSADTPSATTVSTINNNLPKQS